VLYLFPWIKEKILFVINWAKTKIDPDEIFDKTKHAIELAKIEKVQSEINKNNLEGAGSFLKSVENIPVITTLMGSLLIVKLPDSDGISQLKIRILTTDEMIFLNKNPQLCNSPALLNQKLVERRPIE